MPPYRASQDGTFDIPPYHDKVGRRLCMCDPRDFLLDDRAFIEIGRHIVRRGANQFHTAFVRLGIRARPLEARQERMMDIDTMARQFCAHGGRENLHIAREHDEIDI